MSANPAQITLASRDDVAQALRALCAPLGRRTSAGGARLDLGFNAGHHGDDCAGIEAFARPLWGIAPWIAGGGRYEGLDRVLAGLANGFDPAHPEYWGEPRDFDQRFVEAASVAGAVLVAPSLGAALPEAARANLASWLAKANGCKLHDSNWLLFRVMANLAIEALGGAPDAARVAADLDRIEQFHVGDGWYSDGPTAQRDHYVAFSVHFYLLLYVAFAERRDPERCARLRERAIRFAADYAAWFDAEGAAIPIGRSLTYRFAHAAFWGALAFANVEALPWAAIKGLWMRNLRWWLARPILDPSGVLTPGYAYPNALVAEQYIGPGSPYWAFKAFLPLALPAGHPFWRAEESPPDRGDGVASQPHAALIVCRSEEGRHVVGLCAGQWASWRPRNESAKYAKLCYSTRFGFSVSVAPNGLEGGAFDSTLALTEEGEYYRTRRETTDHEYGPRHAASTWRPWPDVEVRTWLVAGGAWHLRVHRIRSNRTLTSVEGGFAVACEGLDRLSTLDWISEERRALAVGSNGRCEVRDLQGRRRGVVFLGSPGSNLMAPRAAIPALLAEHRAGETWLVSAVLGLAGELAPEMPFTISRMFRGMRIEAPGYVVELVQ
jgi:hypothetical protein